MNFKIIGNNWDTDIKQVAAIIDFSGGKDVPSLKAQAHGRLTGNIKVDSKRGQTIISQEIKLAKEANRKR